MERRQSRAVFAGGVQIGGDAPVSVQSMLNVPAHDVEGNVAQAKSLYEAGCEIIRAAVPDLKSVQLIPALKKAVPVPVVADIHFDYRIALACVEAGVDKIRINPGNIGSDERVKAVADACRGAGASLSALASTAVRWKRRSLQSMALRRRRRSRRAPCIMCGCWKNAIFTIL